MASAAQHPQSSTARQTRADAGSAQYSSAAAGRHERLLPGHWEGDLLRGAANRSAVGVLVDSRTLFLMIVRMDGASAQAAPASFSQAFALLPAELRQTLTYDQGKGMILHSELAQSTGLSIYFAEPHSPWQWGICENTNALLRQYLPEGSVLSVYSQRELDAIAWEMNTRPRKTLAFRNPAEVFFEYCFQARDNGTVALDACLSIDSRNKCALTRISPVLSWVLL